MPAPYPVTDQRALTDYFNTFGVPPPTYLDPVNDEAEFTTTSFAIPTTSISFATASLPPGLQVNPYCDGNSSIYVEAEFSLINGTAAFTCSAAIADITVPGSPTIVPGTVDSTVNLVETRPFHPKAKIIPTKGQRVFALLVWLSSASAASCFLRAGVADSYRAHLRSYRA